MWRISRIKALRIERVIVWALLILAAALALDEWAHWLSLP
jgi:hypothetical protein